MQPFSVGTDASRAGPDHQSRSGFTLIELLIVVVIIGILVAIAIPKFGSTKEQAYLAHMKTDLRNLATAQEAYVGDNGTYYIGAVPSAALVYNPSPGTVISIVAATSSGWSATSAYPTQTARTCALFIGTAAPVAPATLEGQIACSP
jgi:prepilin-type N-terminal cleavage/methylation domain-containing protein